MRDEPSQAGLRDARSDEPVVRVRDVVVEHTAGGRPIRALDGVSLSVAPAERLALWGRSGSGKTTLLHVMGGLQTPTSGTVDRAESRSPVPRAGSGTLRAGVAYVFQAPSLISVFTARENVAFAAAYGPGGTTDPDALLALVGLDGKRDHLPHELSGGEQQRVQIARAIALAPRLLLCDEPTGHLDSDTARRILDLLEALQDRERFALVVATHDLDVVARFEREVGLLDGQIVIEERYA
jgi:putative ABC transport system ATP-binding protein